MTDQLRNIAIEAIQANPYQPRKLFSEKELAELATSIKENGLIQPIIVRQSPIIGYELIAGERRLQASRLAGYTEIKAIIKDINDFESQKQAILENLQRSDLTPIEEAQAYHDLIIKNNMTHEELALAMGKSRPYITNSLRLLNLSNSLKEALNKGDISQGHARLLLSIDSETEQELWYQEIISQQLSVRSLEKLLKNKSKKKSQKKINKDVFTRAKEKELFQSLGLKTQITLQKGEKGSVTIFFNSDSDFNTIIHKLLSDVD